jgi:alpha-maltose-1-phosphate synthase
VIVLSHPTANQNVRQTACALAEAGLLKEFWTCVDWNEGGFLDRFLFSRAREELRRRSFANELKPFIKSFPWRELGRHLAGRLGLDWLTKHETGFLSMDAVYHSLDRHVAGRLSSAATIKAVYAYEDAALETFRAAKRLGLKCIYEHPIVYWRKVRELQREEAELHPEWAPTLAALRDSDEKLARKDEELALADLVIAPSTFAKESLAYAPKLTASVQIIPYGAPSVDHSVMPMPKNEKLRVLFVGALSQAKGLGYLLQATARLERQVELTLIGHRVSEKVPEPAVLQRHRWIPSLSHVDLLAEMSRHDVLVLPSLHEGFGLVIFEAMAHGLVVIATPHTAAPEIIEDGVDGFVVPIRSAEAIAEKLARLLTGKGMLEEMKAAALRKAAARPWQTYREQLVSVARPVVQ